MTPTLAPTLMIATLAGLVATAPQTSPTRGGERTVTVGTLSRSYLLHVPAGALPQPASLVLALHGGATNAASMVRLTGLNEKADRERFVVAYPNGSGRLAAVRTWNAGRCCGYAAAEQIDDVAFMRAVLDDIASVVPIDPRRVFATGISNGGQMAYRLAAEMPDRLAAIAPVAASLEVSLPPTPRPVAVLHVHGTADEHVPFEGGQGRRSIGGVDFTPVGRTLDAWVAVNGCRGQPTILALPDEVDDGTWIERRAYTPCRENADVVLYLVHGGGHTWPGRPRAPLLLGRTTRDVSATNLIWDFFARHGG